MPGDWDESKHPRADKGSENGGQFVSGGGGGEGGAHGDIKKKLPAQGASLANDVVDIAKSEGTTPEKVLENLREGIDDAETQSLVFGDLADHPVWTDKGYKGTEYKDWANTILDAAHKALKDKKYSTYAELFDLPGVEIFASGTHNGDKYNEQDLEDMIQAFNNLDFKPPLKSGHSKDEPGMPSLGWVSNLRRNGDKLVADFVGMPKVVYEYIKDRRFNTVSSEIYWDLKRGGKAFRRALKAVALLGADIPAVAGLRPLHELFTADSGDVRTAEEIVLSYADTNTLGESTMTPEEIAALQKQVETAEKLAADEKAAREAVEKKFSQVPDPSATDTFELARRAIANNDNAVEVKLLNERLEAANRTLKAERELRTEHENKLRTYEERLAKLEEERRKDRIGKIAESCRVPAVRVFVNQFMDLATRNGSTVLKVFSSDGSKQVDAVEAVEKFVSWVNENAIKMFSLSSQELSADERRTEQEDVGKEVDRRTKEYMQANQVKDYATAMKAVLDANPPLKQAYADGHRRAA